mmetsp:Transcript_6871/g.9480  ORF Transcript_6871/g.9480 Transcript_6871/m.9480 type:complete len:84 (-) Transcript_6871:240-491(-)
MNLFQRKKADRSNIDAMSNATKKSALGGPAASVAQSAAQQTAKSKKTGRSAAKESRAASKARNDATPPKKSNKSKSGSRYQRQ